MKTKVLKAILAVALIIISVSVFASCAKEENTLSRPRNVVLEDEILSWNEVAGATGYEVEIKTRYTRAKRTASASFSSPSKSANMKCVSGHTAKI